MLFHLVKKGVEDEEPSDIDINKFLKKNPNMTRKHDFMLTYFS